MDIFNLRASLTIDSSEYEKGLNKAKEKNKDFKDDTKKQIGIISADAWTNLAQKVINVGKAIISASLETINYADQIGDLAQKWGFSTREIQEFDYWATLSGSNLESLLTGMRGLVNQAEAGASAFKKLGINVRNDDGTFKRQRDLFLETINALNKMTDQTERNALQFEIFGRSGIELGQVIDRDKEGLEELSREAEDLGIILSENTIEQAGKFNDELDKMKLQAKSVFAEFIAGSEGAEQRLDDFIDNVETKLERSMPKFIELGEKIGGKILEGLGKYIVDKAWGLIKFSFGEGWLWGEKLWDKHDSVGEWLLSSPSGNLFNDNSSSVSSSSSVSNKTEQNNIEININSSGYSQEEAKRLAEEVVKEIATKKQASGR